MEKHDGTESLEESKFRDRQLLAALGPLLSMLTVGLTLGFNTVQLIQLTSDVNESGTEIRITSEGEAHLLFSASSFPTLLGCLLSAILVETVGRRRSLMIIYPVSLIGWASIGLARDISSIAIGRAIHGLAAGLFTPLAPVYIGEISDPRSRSVFLALIDVAIVFGLLIVNHLHAYYLHWRIIVRVCSAVTCLVSLATLASRESPWWLVNRGRAEDALSQWIYLRGWESGMDEYRDASKRVSNAQNRTRINHRLGYLLSKRFLYPFLVSNASFFVYRFSGLNLVADQAIPALVETFKMDNARSATLIVLGLRSIASVLGCHLITKYEMKTLIFNSGSGVVFSLFVLWLTTHFDLRSLWLKDISLLVYFVSLGIGLSPVPWILTGELFSGKLRSFGIGLVLALSYLCYIVDTIVAPELVAEIKVQGVYVIYSLLVIVGVAFLDRVLSQARRNDQTLPRIGEMFDDEFENSGNVEMI